jgi:hypothetical protein
VLRLVRVRNIGLDCERLDAQFLSCTYGFCCRALILQIVDDHMGAEFSKAIDSGAANTTRAAGYYRYFVR